MNLIKEDGIPSSYAALLQETIKAHFQAATFCIFRSPVTVGKRDKNLVYKKAKKGRARKQKGWSGPIGAKKQSLLVDKYARMMHHDTYEDYTEHR